MTRDVELRQIKIQEFSGAASMARAILDARTDGVMHDGDTVTMDARAWREILVAFREYRHARWEYEDFMERGGGTGIRRFREYDGRRELTPLKHPWTR